MNGVMAIQENNKRLGFQTIANVDGRFCSRGQTDETPTGFSKCQLISVEEEIEKSVIIQFNLSSTIKIPAWRFEAFGKSIHTGKAIEVKFSLGEKLFFAENENLSIFASGETAEEVFQEFNQHIVHLYFHYKKLNYNDLIGQAKEYKKIFEDNFSENK